MKLKIEREFLMKHKGKIDFQFRIKSYHVNSEVAKAIDEYVIATVQNKINKEKENEKDEKTDKNQRNDEQIRQKAGE
ncbi:MAG: hypothetical protein K9L02_03000 [Acholeplasmataceae bacterium]|nr:hypothetical protein [Acholeplasmataceae bacterium]